MPMPREEDDDLFHDVDDVEFDDSADEKPKKKTAKKKAAKKKVAKKVAKKKTVKKKKAKRVSVADDEGVKVKKAPARRKKKAAPKKDDGEGFGAGLFDGEDTPKPTKAKAAPAEDDSAKPEATEEKPKRRRGPKKRVAKAEKPPVEDEPLTEEVAEEAASEDDTTDEYGRPEPVANYVVHVYELGRLKRTIDRDFTPELAEKYAVEFSRTAKKYGRKAIAGKKDTQPAKELVEEEA